MSREQGEAARALGRRAAGVQGREGGVTDRQTAGRDVAIFDDSEFDDGSVFAAGAVARFDASRFDMGDVFGPKEAPSNIARFDYAHFDRGFVFDD